MAVVTVELRDDIIQYVGARVQRETLGESEVVADLVRSGFEHKLQSLYQAYQEGEISLGYLAEQLGITTWRAYHVLEERGWRTANV